MGVPDFLPGRRAAVLERQDVAQPHVPLQVVDALRVGAQHPLDGRLVGFPQRHGMLRVLDDHLVRAGRIHAVVHPHRLPVGGVFHLVKRMRMRIHHG